MHRLASRSNTSSCEVRIAMDHPKRLNGNHQARTSRWRVGCAPRACRPCARACACREPIESQEPPGRKSDQGRGTRISLLPAASRVEQHVLASADIELLADAGANLLRDLAGVDAGPCAWIANNRPSCCRSASDADCMSGYCSLQASPVPSCARAWCTCERGAAAG